MTRKRAFLTHLALSALLAATLVATFVLFVFPMPFFVEDGGFQGIRLIVVVDVILGPLLTLIVFNPAKSRVKLAFDLAVIGFLQLSAFSFGLWNVYNTRTESVIYVDGTFYPMAADYAASFQDEYQKLAREARERPFFALIDLPDDANARQNLRMESLRTGVPLYRRFDLLRPLDARVIAELEISAKPPSKLPGGDAVAQGLQKWATDRSARLEEFFFVPTYARYGRIITALNRSDLRVVGFISSVKLPD